MDIILVGIQEKGRGIPLENHGKLHEGLRWAVVSGEGMISGVCEEVDWKNHEAQIEQGGVE